MDKDAITLRTDRILPQYSNSNKKSTEEEHMIFNKLIQKKIFFEKRFAYIKKISYLCTRVLVFYGFQEESRQVLYRKNTQK